MADFDAILKEVEALRDEHLKLQVLIPKLNEESKGLRQSIVDAQKELVKLEERQQETKASTQNSITYAQNSIASERVALDEEIRAHKEAVSVANKDISSRLAIVLQKEAELSTKKNELANLLQEQVDGDKALQEQLVQFEKRVADFVAKDAKFNEDIAILEKEKNKLNDLTVTMSNEEASLASERAIVDSMTKEAQALLKTAQNKSYEVSEQNNLLQLRIDEYNRKDELMKTNSERLRQREIAINDKQRVYNSH